RRCISRLRLGIALVWISRKIWMPTPDAPGGGMQALGQIAAIFGVAAAIFVFLRPMRFRLTDASVDILLWRWRVHGVPYADIEEAKWIDSWRWMFTLRAPLGKFAANAWPVSGIAIRKRNGRYIWINPPDARAFLQALEGRLGTRAGQKT